MRSQRAAAVAILVLMACREAPPAEVVEVRAAVEEANEAFIRTARTTDPAHLRSRLEGPILQSMSAAIDAVRKRGQYAESKLLSLKWGEAKVSGDIAEIETIERWEHTHFNAATHRCRVRLAPRTIRQTYHLRRANGKWMIHRIVADPGNPQPEPRRCP